MKTQTIYIPTKNGEEYTHELKHGDPLLQADRFVFDHESLKDLLSKFAGYIKIQKEINPDAMAVDYLQMLSI